MAPQGDDVLGPFAWTRQDFDRYEASGGLSGGTIRGKRVVVLTTYDADTGHPRKTPLMRVKQGREYAVVGSRGGAAEHPQWYRDVLAKPLVVLQDGVYRAVYRAHVATGSERAVWWQRAVEEWPDYAADQQRVERVIPVVVLTPQA